jgi:hypothetical protein
MSTRIALSVKETQAALSLGRTTIYKLLATKQLQRAKIHGRTLITLHSIQNLISEAVEQGAGQ